MHGLAFILVGFIGGTYFGLVVGAMLASARWADECSECLSRKAGK